MTRREILKGLGLVGVTGVTGAAFGDEVVADGGKLPAGSVGDPNNVWFGRHIFPLEPTMTDGPSAYVKDGKIIFELPRGVYHLIETKAPDGYCLRTDVVEVTVTGETDSEDKDFGPGSRLRGVNYDDGTVLSSDGSGEKYVAETQVYTLKISNSAGHELPSTGGSGTRSFTLAGLLLMAASLLMFMYLKLRSRRQVV